MRKVSDIATANEATDQFNDGIADDKPLGFQWNKEIKVNHGIRKHHTESQKQTVNGSRSTDSGHQVEVLRHRHSDSTKINIIVFSQLSGILNVLHQFLAQAGTNATYHVEKQESLRTPHIFECVTEHPQGEHVEKQMFKVAVHKHVSDDLVRLEIGGHEKMQSQNAVQIDVEAIQGESGQKHQNVDNQQILNDCWQNGKSRWTKLLTHLLLNGWELRRT